MILGPVLLSLLLGSPADAPPERPRLVVLTDISSLKAGVAEPDDGQSLIRLMLYANDFDIEGLVASSNLGHGQAVRPDLIRRVVAAYGQARPSLVLHDDRYPPASHLDAAVKAGQPIAGPKVAIADGVGEGKDTEASDWIIRVADRPDPRPAWVLIWGGSTDLAQALWKVRATRTPEELARFVAKLRVHAIGDQDSTGPWIRAEFPGLFAITQRRAYRGMYRGGDTALTSPAWVREHIHGHGPLGDLYPDYRGGDIWSSKLGPVRGIKEGDTPSFLALIPVGLGEPGQTGVGTWGGRFERVGGSPTDVPDPGLDMPEDPDPRIASVHRWRPAFQADFQARLDWCVRPFDRANHPPQVRIAGGRERTVRAGMVATIDAGETSDPDGDPLDFGWAVESPSPASSRAVRFEVQDAGRAGVVVGPELAGQTIRIRLSVTDRGRPALARYGVVTLKVE
ncbi:nucleoside hydrolase-like domain-containing protein [Tundrisphaera sp. TA3]|uniref:nucleoside hydrolase-like domain-containing protein n=1 Tax=Tundrisphaera sp. TA3 TaxID=3435775 RepID=UPI003EBAAAED